MLDFRTKLCKAVPIHNFGGATLIDMDPVYDLVCDDCLDDHGIRLRVAVWKYVFRRKSDGDTRFQVLARGAGVRQSFTAGPPSRVAGTPCGPTTNGEDLASHLVIGALGIIFPRAFSSPASPPFILLSPILM